MDPVLLRNDYAISEGERLATTGSELGWTPQQEHCGWIRKIVQTTWIVQRPQKANGFNPSSCNQESRARIPPKSLCSHCMGALQQPERVRKSAHGLDRIGFQMFVKCCNVMNWDVVDIYFFKSVKTLRIYPTPDQEFFFGREKCLWEGMVSQFYLWVSGHVGHWGCPWIYSSLLVRQGHWLTIDTNLTWIKRYSKTCF